MRYRGPDTQKRKAKRREGVQPEEPPTFDDVLLYERAEAGRTLIKSKDNVDPLEVLAAVVWPTQDMLAAQIAAREAA